MKRLDKSQVKKKINKLIQFIKQSKLGLLINPSLKKKRKIAKQKYQRNIKYGKMLN